MGHDGKTPPDVVAVLHLVRQSGETQRLLIFVWWFLVRLFFFHRMSAGRHTDSTPDGRRVPICVHDYRAFRAVQAALQTETAAVVSGHELASCGNRGNSMPLLSRYTRPC